MYQLKYVNTSKWVSIIDPVFVLREKYYFPIDISLIHCINSTDAQSVINAYFLSDKLNHLLISLGKPNIWDPGAGLPFLKRSTFCQAQGQVMVSWGSWEVRVILGPAQSREFKTHKTWPWATVACSKTCWPPFQKAKTPPKMLLGTKVGWFSESTGSFLLDMHSNISFSTIWGWKIGFKSSNPIIPVHDQINSTSSWRYVLGIK